MRGALNINKWPIIVGGCHRSGTSLLRRILNANDSIYAGPEVKFFRDFYQDYNDDPYVHVRFFNTARSILPEKELFSKMGRAYIEIQGRAAELNSKARWADKTPENVLYLNEWSELLGEEWLFVHVVRNPLDTLSSIKEARFDRSIPIGLDERLAFYSRYLNAGLDFQEQHPDRYYRVMYEELVTDTEKTLTSLMSWLGEEFQRKQLKFNDQLQGDGIEDPKVNQKQTISTDSVGSWRKRLNYFEKRKIIRNTKELWLRVDPELEWWEV